MYKVRTNDQILWSQEPMVVHRHQTSLFLDCIFSSRSLNESHWSVLSHSSFFSCFLLFAVHLSSCALHSAILLSTKLSPLRLHSTSNRFPLVNVQDMFTAMFDCGSMSSSFFYYISIESIEVHRDIIYEHVSASVGSTRYRQYRYGERGQYLEPTWCYLSGHRYVFTALA